MYEGGDASTRAVALIQDPKMASLKNTSGTRELLQPGLSRGRSGYAQFGIIRTKPGMQPPYELQASSCNSLHEIRESRRPGYPVHVVQ